MFYKDYYITQEGILQAFYMNDDGEKIVHDFDMTEFCLDFIQVTFYTFI